MTTAGKRQPKLAAITVNYQVAELALDAIASLLEQLEGIPSLVYLVDNASPDGSAEVLRKGIAERGWQDRVELIASPKNGGFGAGNNLAIRDALAREAPPEYIYLLNPDATLFPNALQSLLSFMDENPSAGIAASFLETDGKIWSPGFRYPNVLDQFEQGLRLGMVSKLLEEYLQRMPVPDHPTEVEWVGGPSFIIRRSVLDQVGLFDEQFFLYFEETDLCFRARQAGFPSYIVPASIVRHIGQASTKLSDHAKRRPKYWFESRRYFFEKNHGTAYRVAADAGWLVGLMAFRARYFVQRRTNPDPPQLILDFVRYNLGLLR